MNFVRAIVLHFLHLFASDDSKHSRVQLLSRGYPFCSSVHVLINQPWIPPSPLFLPPLSSPLFLPLPPPPEFQTRTGVLLYVSPLSGECDRRGSCWGCAGHISCVCQPHLLHRLRARVQQQRPWRHGLYVCNDNVQKRRFPFCSTSPSPNFHLGVFALSVWKVMLCPSGSLCLSVTLVSIEISKHKLPNRKEIILYTCTLYSRVYKCTSQVYFSIIFVKRMNSLLLHNS